MDYDDAAASGTPVPTADLLARTADSVGVPVGEVCNAALALTEALRNGEQYAGSDIELDNTQLRLPKPWKAPAAPAARTFLLHAPALIGKALADGEFGITDAAGRIGNRVVQTCDVVVMFVCMLAYHGTHRDVAGTVQTLRFADFVLHGLFTSTASAVDRAARTAINATFDRTVRPILKLVDNARSVLLNANRALLYIADPANASLAAARHALAGDLTALLDSDFIRDFAQIIGLDVAWWYGTSAHLTKNDRSYCDWVVSVMPFPHIIAVLALRHALENEPNPSEEAIQTIHDVFARAMLVIQTTFSLEHGGSDTVFCVVDSIVQEERTRESALDMLRFIEDNISRRRHGTSLSRAQRATILFQHAWGTHIATDSVEAVPLVLNDDPPLALPTADITAQWMDGMGVAAVPAATIGVTRRRDDDHDDDDY